MKRVITACLMSVFLGGGAFAAPAHIEAAVADSARPAADTARDKNRLPAALIEFAGIQPGMQVVDLLPGGGYFTRIFAKTVGDKGHVYAYVSTGGDARLISQGKDPNNQLADLKAAYPNISVLHTALDVFATPQKVDLVWTSDNYHDMHNGPNADANVAALNKAIFNALKPGGIYIVIDHRAAKGAGPGVTSTLHRMDEDIVKKEVLAAGFQLAAESTILTRSADDNTKKVFEAGEQGMTDQMVLKFRKP